MTFVVKAQSEGRRDPLLMAQRTVYGGETSAADGVCEIAEVKVKGDGTAPRWVFAV